MRRGSAYQCWPTWEQSAVVYCLQVVNCEWTVQKRTHPLRTTLSRYTTRHTVSHRQRQCNYQMFESKSKHFLSDASFMLITKSDLDTVTCTFVTSHSADKLTCVTQSQLSPADIILFVCQSLESASILLNQ